MASKLFRAVVGFGIGLGATSAACFGATEGSTVGGDLSAYDNDASSSSSKPPSKTTYNDPPDAPPPPPAQDAAPDVVVIADAGADAFCDAAWPTTKGNPRPTSCDDPRWACVDAGEPVYCVGVDDAGACDWGSAIGTTSECVNAQWQCPTGTVSADQCK